MGLPRNFLNYDTTAFNTPIKKFGVGNVLLNNDVLNLKIDVPTIGESFQKQQKQNNPFNIGNLNKISLFTPALNSASTETQKNAVPSGDQSNIDKLTAETSEPTKFQYEEAGLDIGNTEFSKKTITNTTNNATNPNIEKDGTDDNVNAMNASAIDTPQQETQNRMIEMEKDETKGFVVTKQNEEDEKNGITRYTNDDGSNLEVRKDKDGNTTGMTKTLKNGTIEETVVATDGSGFNKSVTNKDKKLVSTTAVTYSAEGMNEKTAKYASDGTTIDKKTTRDVSRTTGREKTTIEDIKHGKKETIEVEKDAQGLKCKTTVSSNVNTDGSVKITKMKTEKELANGTVETTDYKKKPEIKEKAENEEGSLGDIQDQKKVIRDGVKEKVKDDVSSGIERSKELKTLKEKPEKDRTPEENEKIKNLESKEDRFSKKYAKKEAKIDNELNALKNKKEPLTDKEIKRMNKLEDKKTTLEAKKEAHIDEKTDDELNSTVKDAKGKKTAKYEEYQTLTAAENGQQAIVDKMKNFTMKKDGKEVEYTDVELSNLAKTSDCIDEKGNINTEALTEAGITATISPEKILADPQFALANGSSEDKKKALVVLNAQRMAQMAQLIQNVQQVSYGANQPRQQMGFGAQPLKFNPFGMPGVK